MTDITELAQREKFEAWARSQKLGLSYGDCGYVFSSTEMAWRAWMTSSAELVEALEKEQKRIAELESRTVTVKLPTTRLWAGVTECYEKSDVIAAIRSAGMEVSDD
ncbi:TPA: hypothetical protein ACRR3Z_004479 [Klebsiella quasipneumoniae]